MSVLNASVNDIFELIQFWGKQDLSVLVECNKAQRE